MSASTVAGKPCYSREFLISLKDSPLSMSRPDQLPHLSSMSCIKNSPLAPENLPKILNNEWRTPLNYVVQRKIYSNIAKDSGKIKQPKKTENKKKSSPKDTASTTTATTTSTTPAPTRTSSPIETGTTTESSSEENLTNSLLLALEMWTRKID